MTKLQGLIFDLDGTLVDSAPDLRNALNKVLAAHGRRSVTLDEMKSYTGDGMLPQLQRAFAATGEALGLDESYKIFQDYVIHYRQQKADMAQIYPQAVETLQHYKKAGVRLGICTNKQGASTAKLLDELDLAQYFTFVAGGDTFMVHKPNPGHVQGVIDALKVPAEGCIMVGDSSNDVLAAKGAGIPCLVVTHGYGVGLDQLGADGLIGNFGELETALQRLGFSLA